MIRVTCSQNICDWHTSLNEVSRGDADGVRENAAILSAKLHARIRGLRIKLVQNWLWADIHASVIIPPASNWRAKTY
jgi:hypothetical protein